jgi:hypothetical protein
MYIRKPLIEKTWPIFPNDKPISPDIRKFEALGTRSFAPEQAIGQAIDFHNAIGGKRKQERLHYLKRFTGAMPSLKIHGLNFTSLLSLNIPVPSVRLVSRVWMWVILQQNYFPDMEFTRFPLSGKM